MVWFKDGSKGKPIRIWPRLERPFPAEARLLPQIPEAVKIDFREASKTEELSPVASATLSRRCMQTILKDKFQKQIGAATKLKAQVKAVLDANVLPPFISDELHGIRSIGNMGAHASFDPETNELIEVESGEASACLDVLEGLIKFCYVDPILSAERKANREKKFGPDEK